MKKPIEQCLFDYLSQMLAIIERQTDEEIRTTGLRALSASRDLVAEVKALAGASKLKQLSAFPKMLRATNKMESTSKVFNDVCNRKRHLIIDEEEFFAINKKADDFMKQELGGASTTN